MLCNYYVQVYAEGPARPTGGAAAMAMLIVQSLLSLLKENKYKASHMLHV